jgi:hypothetical protein
MSLPVRAFAVDSGAQLDILVPTDGDQIPAGTLIIRGYGLAGDGHSVAAEALWHNVLSFMMKRDDECQRLSAARRRRVVFGKLTS